MRIPKVGDWIKSGLWRQGGGYYCVTRVADGRVHVRVQEGKSDTASYKVDYCEWQFRDPEPALNLSKPVQTRDGRKVRILCTDAKLGWGKPIVGLVDTPSGEIVSCWGLNGEFSTEPGQDHNDLVNAPTEKRRARKTFYLMHWPHGDIAPIGGRTHVWSYPPAPGVSGDNWQLLGSKEVEIVEGEGLDAPAT